MSPRQDVSEERKSQIMDAAINVFARQGFHQARMDDIAEEAGLSKGALYLYYKSKDAVVGAIFTFIFSQLMKRVNAFVAADDGGSVRDKLLKLNRYFAIEMRWMLSSLTPILFEFYAVAARQKDVRQSLKEYFQEYRTALATLIRRGIEQGEFRPVDPEAVAITHTALYEGLALLTVVDPQGLDWERAGDTSLRLLLDGLAVRSPDHPDQ